MSVSTPVAHRRLTFDDVLRMCEVGILDERERVELRDGVLVEMSPESIDHGNVIELLNNALGERYAGHEPRVRVCTTMYIDETNYLLPDLMIRTGPAVGWPTPEAVPLIIEVAYSSRRYDLEVKSLDYAQWGAPSYWVVDLVRREVVVHTDPRPDGYGSVERVGEDAPLSLPGAPPLRLSEVLPPR